MLFARASVALTLPRPENPLQNALHRHADTWIEPSRLGSSYGPYLPTFPFDGPYINANHRYYAECPMNGALISTDVIGWLRPQDALKLYELAFFANGDVLELGCNHGLSTSIMSQAIRDADLGRWIDSVDLDPAMVEVAKANLERKRLATNTRLYANEAAACCRELAAANKTFGLVFVDHSHAFEPVLTVCRELPSVVKAGGFAIFHDYNDERNVNRDDRDYGVSWAVLEGLNPGLFEFYGIHGCCGLFRRRP